MKHEILTNYIDILHRTWEIYHASQALHLSKQHRAALEIGILEAEGKYKAATIELQQELDLNKPAYSTTENHKIDFLVKHMMLPEPLQIQADQTNNLEKAQIIRRRKKIMKGVTFTAENESKREHLSTMLINGLYEHVNQLKNKIIKDFEPKKIKKKEVLSFGEIFKSKDDFHNVLNILRNEKLIDKQSNVWIDNQKGNKGLLIVILKDLRNKGYYKKGTTPTNDQYRQIAIDFFSFEVSIDTVKRPGSHNTAYIPALNTQTTLV